MKKAIILMAALAMMVSGANAKILRENLLEGYSVGDVLEKGNFIDGVDNVELCNWYGALTQKPWTVSSATIKPGLTYDGYPVGGPSIDLGVKSGEKGNRATLCPVESKGKWKKGAYYLAFLINLDQIDSKKHTELVGLSQLDKVCKNRPALQAIGEDGKIVFISNLGKLQAKTSKKYDLGKTHLVVLKADIDNQKASVFVDPKAGEAEPAPDAMIENDGSNSLGYIKAISIKNRSGQKGSVGNFRLATTWDDLFVDSSAPAAE